MERCTHCTALFFITFFWRGLWGLFLNRFFFFCIVLVCLMWLIQFLDKFCVRTKKNDLFEGRDKVQCSK